ncbi:MAG: hypothetical protein C3F06_05270 [Candidatus Methanoperedenaceae archaeon]|nr:MAG: hypothetical protein C3F06_05270 [Candidatus Methanoperedenaceae archaeon]
MGPFLKSPLNRIINLSVIFCFLIIYPVSVIAYSDTNFAANPGFESGTAAPLNWTFVSQDGNTPAWSNISHSGLKSIEINIPGTMGLNSGFSESDMISAQPFTEYTFSAWGKTRGVNGANIPTITFGELDADMNLLRLTNLPLFSRGTNDWEQKIVGFKTGANTSYIYFYVNIQGGYGTFWIDDVELNLKDTPAPTPAPTVTPIPILSGEFTNGNWQTNWVIDSPAGNLVPAAYAENGKTDLILFTVPKGSQAGKDGTNKIMTKGGDKFGYGTYEARFKFADTNFQNSNTGIYAGMGLWNFDGPTQQEVMMGFYYNPGAHDYIEVLTTKNRPRGSTDTSNLYHSKIVDPNVVVKDFSGVFRTIKIVYEPDKVSGYLDGNLILTKTDLIPTEPMTLVIGGRVTGGTLSSDLKVVWDYVKIT